MKTEIRNWILSEKKLSTGKAKMFIKLMRSYSLQELMDEFHTWQIANNVKIIDIKLSTDFHDDYVAIYTTILVLWEQA
jgi:hypothetical protein